MEEEIVKRKRGRPPKNPDKPVKPKMKNRGTDGTNTSIRNKLLGEKQEEISRIINESVQFFKRKPVKTNEELAERLDEYFSNCVNKGQIPTVEDMCLALGVTRMTLYNWETGVQTNPERAEIVQKAKEILAAIDAKLVSEGKIPQVTYIFRSKNYFGMRDQQEVVLTPNVDPLGEGVDTERLKQKYLENTYGMNDEIKVEMLPEGNESAT